jgi:hypothetical protein
VFSLVEAEKNKVEAKNIFSRSIKIERMPENGCPEAEF